MTEALMRFLRNLLLLVRYTLDGQYGPFLASLLAIAMAIGAMVAAQKTINDEQQSSQAAFIGILTQKTVPSREIQHPAIAVAAIQLLNTRLRDKDEGSARSAFAKKLALTASKYQPQTAIQPEEITVKKCDNRTAYTTEIKKSDGSKPNPGRFVFLPQQLTTSDNGVVGARATKEAGKAAAHVKQLERIVEDHSAGKFVIVHAYYITSGGAIATVPLDKKKACEQYLDDSYSLSERPYMVALRKKDLAESFFQTGPYLDVNGKGIVDTVCKPYKKNGILDGATCVDFAYISRASLDNMFKDGVKWHKGLLRAKVVTHATSNKENRSTGFCDENKCSVPIYDKMWLEISYRPPSNAWTILAAILVLVAGIVVTYFARQTGMWRRTEAQFAILRDLPEGLLYVATDIDDDTSMILAASDRAEELLDRELPAFGSGLAANRSQLQQDFWNIFCEYGFTEGEVPGEWCWSENIMKEVIDMRRRGSSSTYRVRLRRRRRTGETPWLEVRGTPEIRHTGEDSRAANRSFSVIVEVNKADWEELDKRAQHNLDESDCQRFL